DPVIVTGRLYTRDWVDDEGNKRLQYELEATAVGHDLSRGRSRVERDRASTATSAVDDEQARQRVGGERPEPVPAAEAPAQLDDTPYDPTEPPEEPHPPSTGAEAGTEPAAALAVAAAG